jgi:hypothetical protein
VAAAVVLVAVALATPSADAQYFGRNKVRYDAREVHVLKTEHFDVHYDDKTEEAAHVVGRLAERWNERLSTLLDHPLRGRQPILFYAGHPDFEQTNAIDGDLPEATGGVTDGQKRRVVLPAAGPLAETDHVLGHELVHAFQYDIVGRGPRTERLPLWFIEGMAEYLSLGPVDTHTEMWLRDAARSGPLPRVRELDNPKYFPYRYGHALWAYVGGRWGDAAVGEALKAARESRGALRALQKVTGLTEEQLSHDWHAAIHEAYGGDDAVKKASAPPPARGAKPMAQDREGYLNLAPALSPDGRRLVFLSERDGGTVELFLADAETGKVQRRLLQRRLDTHFESLQFVGSAGAWAPDGRRFAFAGVRQGRAIVSILDADAGRIERDIEVPEVDEILNPTWSPDGTRIAFSAMRGGFADLFVYDLAAGHLEALTDDAYGDLEPVWDPSGESITFVSDRFSTDLDHLRWGNYRLARFVLATHAIEPVPSFPDAKNVNPQWSGKTLFFLSDRGGVSNVYRLDDGVIRQVTEVPVGLAGLTELSPALAAAAAAPRLVTTAFVGGRYRLKTLQEPGILAGCELEEAPRVAMLPPQSREGSTVRDLLADAERGLPATSAEFSAERYSARLSRDGFAEPFLSVGGDRFGVSVVGGGSAFWSDLLGNHRLSAGLLMNGGPKDLSGVLAYENLTHRWNWGAWLGQTTWRAASISSGLGEQDGQTVSMEQLVRFREIDRTAGLRVAYPFARGKRLELSSGFRRVSFTTESDIQTYAFDTGRSLGDRSLDVASPPGLDLSETTVAFVQDEARFGPTSAVEGTRLRAELTPTLGTKSFLGVRFDYRRFLHPVWPLTLAGRVLHYGRYGKDADDPRLARLFTGYSTFVRGYDGPGAFPCSPRSCASLDPLMGSKMLVTNLELRAPALFFLGKARAYGPIPSEWVVFYDAATTWRNGDTPPIFGSSREWIRSWGLGLRVNLFNFMIGEVDYVRPLDLPGTSGLVRARVGAGF